MGFRSIGLIFACCSAALAGPDPSPVSPVFFEAAPGREPAFVAHSAGLTLSLRASGAGLLLDGAQSPVRLIMIGAGRTAAPEGKNPASNSGRRFAAVLSRDVFPGVDILYHGRRHQLEYDFIVKPGADPGRIRMAFEGAVPLLERDGALLLRTPSGSIRQSAPVIYQEAGGRRIPVFGRYRLEAGQVTFALGAYDRSRELVIDPVLTAVYSSGAAKDRFHAFTSSAAGICAAGETAAGRGLVVWMPASGEAARLEFGSQGSTAALAITGDCGPGTIVAGRTSATDLPVASNAPAGATDGFLMALGSDLKPVNSLYVGGSGEDSLVSLDRGYVAGSTGSADIAGFTSRGGTDAILATYSLDSEGRVSARVMQRYGGPGDDRAVVIRQVDRVGDAPESEFIHELVLAGTTTSRELPGVRDGAGWGGGGSDAFYVRFRSGEMVSAAFAGGAGADELVDMTADAGSGALRLLLNTDSPELPGPARALAGMTPGGRDAAVIRINGDDSVAYNLRIGGAGDDWARAISETTVFGVTESDSGLPLVNPVASRRAGGAGSFLITFDDSAEAQPVFPVTFGTYFGAPGEDTAGALAIPDSRSFLLAGSKAGESFVVRLSPGAEGEKTGAQVRLAQSSAPRTAATAAFLGSDSTTQGAWKTLYGGDGYYIPNLATNYPSYVTVTRTGGTPYTWDPNPGGPEAPRALDRPTPPGRFASAVIDGTKFDFDLNFTDGQTHRVALYMTDWQSSTATESVTILDQATGAVLDLQNVTSYRSGRWLVYMLSGRVIVRLTRTGGSWVQLNGIFFGGSGSSSISATRGATQSAAVNAAFASALEVTVRDGGNAPVAGAVVTFTAPGSGASTSLSAATAITNASGIASVTATANAIAGSYAVTAAANGSSTAFSLTNLAGPPASIQATGGTPQTAIVNTAFAAALQVTVRDASNNPIGGVQVTFTPPGSGATASLSSQSVFTNAQGIASVTATANGAAGGPYQVVASAGGAGSVNLSLTNAANLPASITATGGVTQSATVGTAFGAPLQVSVKNAGGNPVSGVQVIFTAPAAGASANLSSTTATTNASGMASVTATANGTAGGPYTVSAGVSGVAVAATFQLTNNAIGGGGASAVFLGADDVTKGAWKAQYGGDGYFIPAVATAYPPYASVAVTGAPFTWFYPGPSEVRALDNPTGSGKSATSVIDSQADQFDINLTDGQPHRVALYLMDWNNGYAQTVQIFDKSTNAPLDTARSVTNYNTGRWLVYRLQGRVLVKVTRTGGSYAQVSGIFFGEGSGGTVSSIGGTPQSATINTPFANPLQVSVRDGANAPLPGVLVTFSTPSTGAGAGLSLPSVTTGNSGVASVIATANGTAGGYQVTASANGKSVTFSLTNLVGPPASIATSSGTPQTATVNTAFATPLKAVVRDAGNNPVPGVTVNFAVPGSGPSAGLSASSAVTDSAGVASVTATANAAVGGPYNVSASVSGAGTTNFVLTNSAGAPASVTATGGASQSAIVSTPFAQALQAIVKDAGNNPVPGVTVNFAVPGSGPSASLSSPSAVTNSSGVASVTATANATVGGPYNVSASASGAGTGQLRSDEQRRRARIGDGHRWSLAIGDRQYAVRSSLAGDRERCREQPGAGCDRELRRARIGRQRQFVVSVRGDERFGCGQRNGYGKRDCRWTLQRQCDGERPGRLDSYVYPHEHACPTGFARRIRRLAPDRSHQHGLRRRAAGEGARCRRPAGERSHGQLRRGGIRGGRRPVFLNRRHVGCRHCQRKRDGERNRGRTVHGLRHRGRSGRSGQLQLD